MGQDTTATLILTYQIERTKENILLIKKFIDSGEFSIILNGEYFNFDDDTIDYICIHNHTPLKYKKYIKDEFLFSDIVTNKLYYNFYIKICELYARNISRQLAFMNDYKIKDVNEYMNTIINAQEKFKKIDKNCVLKLQYTFVDDY